jgi:hypothetical protein
MAKNQPLPQPETKKHFACSPSSLRRRELCPGSYWLEKNLPEQTSADAEIGTRMHAATALVIQGASSEELLPFSDFTAEQWDACDWCADKVGELAWPEARVLSEHKFDLRWFHPEIGGGTADLVLVQDFVRAIVIDFKFGRAPVPPAGENLQLASYAAGVRNDFDVPEVQVCIIQPALAVCQVQSIASGTERRAIDAAARALNPGAKPTPSAEACKYCKASGQCPAQTATALVAKDNLDLESIEAKERAGLLSMDRIAVVLAAWEDSNAESIIGAMKERLHEAYMGGYRHPAWAFGKGRPSRTWSEGAPAVMEALASVTGKQRADVWETNLKSPAQLEKLFGKGKEAKAAMEAVIVRTEGKPRLERANA